MKKYVLPGIIAALLVGLFLYIKIGKDFTNGGTPIVSTTVSTSPLFGYLSTWLPNAIWDSPKQITRQTFYGTIPGMISEGKIVEKNATISRNYENIETMKKLGFVADVYLDADGPGASNWGYTKIENGKTTVVIFSYSSGAMRGPDVTVSPNEIPTIYVSVFVSDPFIAK